MSANVSETVINVLAEQAFLEPEDIELTATLEALGVDSLGLVEAIFALEEAFDIEIPFNANDPSDSEFDITNVASMIKAIESLVAAKV